MKPLVSVIIPTYKGEDKISRAVESVLSQTYSNVEIIVIDDNGQGTEHQKATEQIMRRYTAAENVVYLIHDVNKNGAAARNTGIHNSKGEYICFLDDDDVFLPYKIEKQVARFEDLTENYGMVFGFVEEYVSSETIWYHNTPICEETFLFDFLCDNVNACSSTVMIRRTVLDTVKEWDESFRRHQDWEFFARVAFDYKVAQVPEYCVRKYKLDQNLPKDGKTAELYRNHFLEKMHLIIQSFDKRHQHKIYDHHFIDVGKVYLKNKDIVNALRLAFKTSYPIKAIMVYIVDGFRYIIKRT